MAAEDALATPHDVFIADDTTSFLTPRLVADLQGRGIAVLGVYDPDEESGKQRLRDLGVSGVIDADASAEAFLHALNRIVVKSTSGLAPAPEWPTSDEATDGEPEHPNEPGPEDRIVAVTGASGGVGATEAAIALTFAISKRGESAVLVDADDIGPSVAQRLGLDISPNIRTAVDMVRRRSADLTDTLRSPLSNDVEVLVGLANRRDWFELRPPEVSEVLLELASARDRVVVNVGPRAEDLPAMGGPARYGVARAILALADAVFLVASPSPVGATRVLDWVAETRPLVGSTPVHIVFNRCTGSRFVSAELEAELARACRPRSVTFLPLDQRLAAATWRGQALTNGGFFKAIERLAASALPARHRAGGGAP